MIDDPNKTDLFIAMLKESHPIQTKNNVVSCEGDGTATPDISIPGLCNVIDVFYTGDVGGILCCLDIGGPDTKSPHLVSITHLAFDRRFPLAREIDVYQRHRNKKLKQQQSRGY